MSEHTTLPWEHYAASTNGLDVDCANVGCIQGAGWNIALVFADGGIGRDGGKANAAFIVRAANAHANLLALAESVAAHFAGTDAPLGVQARAILAKMKS